MGKKKPFPEERKFGGKTYHSPSFHNDKKAARHTAENYRRREGGSARVVKGKNIVGDTKYVVYRKGGRAGSARRIARRQR